MSDVVRLRACESGKGSLVSRASSRLLVADAALPIEASGSSSLTGQASEACSSACYFWRIAGMVCCSTVMPTNNDTPGRV